jgi:F-type H+-transporting ATPase subunit b
MAGESHSVDAATQSAGGGFPPFDASLFSSQIFWFWVAFGALYIVLAIAIIPRIARTLSHRRSTIEADLKAAAEQAAAAQEARTRAEQAAGDARAQARKTIEEMRALNDAAAAQAEAKATAAAALKISKAEEKIAAARTSELAAAIVEQVSGIKPTAAALTAALKQTSREGVA